MKEFEKIKNFLDSDISNTNLNITNYNSTDNKIEFEIDDEKVILNNEDGNISLDVKNSSDNAFKNLQEYLATSSIANELPDIFKIEDMPNLPLPDPDLTFSNLPPPMNAPLLNMTEFEKMRNFLDSDTSDTKPNITNYKSSEDNIEFEIDGEKVILNNYAGNISLDAKNSSDDAVEKLKEYLATSSIANELPAIFKIEDIQMPDPLPDPLPDPNLNMTEFEKMRNFLDTDASDAKPNITNYKSSDDNIEFEIDGEKVILNNYAGNISLDAKNSSDDAVEKLKEYLATSSIANELPAIFKIEDIQMPDPLPSDPDFILSNLPPPMNSPIEDKTNPPEDNPPMVWEGNLRDQLGEIQSNGKPKGWPVFNEILKTEQDYRKVLEKIIERGEDLKHQFPENETDYLSKDEFETLLTLTRNMLNSSNTLIQALENGDMVEVNKILEESAPLYAEYSSIYKILPDVITRDDKKIVDLFKKNNPNGERLDQEYLVSLLMQPVQRFPRYTLLANDLLKTVAGSDWEDNPPTDSEFVKMYNITKQGNKESNELKGRKDTLSAQKKAVEKLAKEKEIAEKLAKEEEARSFGNRLALFFQGHIMESFSSQPSLASTLDVTTPLTTPTSNTTPEPINSQEDQTSLETTSQATTTSTPTPTGVPTISTEDETTSTEATTTSAPTPTGVSTTSTEEETTSSIFDEPSQVKIFSTQNKQNMLPILSIRQVEGDTGFEFKSEGQEDKDKDKDIDLVKDKEKAQKQKFSKATPAFNNLKNYLDDPQNRYNHEITEYKASGNSLNFEIKDAGKVTAQPEGKEGVTFYADSKIDGDKLDKTILSICAIAVASSTKDTEFDLTNCPAEKKEQTYNALMAKINEKYKDKDKPKIKGYSAPEPKKKPKPNS